MPFGSAAILSCDLDILEIEAKFTDSAHVGISITRKPKQFDQLVDIPTTLETVNSDYAIYLAPSGIRAYLVEDSISKSTTSKPSNYSTIAESLLDLHNIQINPDTCTWIKLIPNLSHLNGMTTQISDYFRPVTNIKYLVWPLELCFAQRSQELAKSLTSPRSPTPIDPLSLIDDFVSLKASAHIKTPSTAPTSNNTPLNFDHHTNNDHAILKNETPQSVQPSLIVTNEPSNSATPAVAISQGEEVPESNNWDYLNEELFGDGADDDEINESDFDFFDNATTTTNNLGNDNNNNNMNGSEDALGKNDDDNDDDDISIDVDELLDDDEMADNLASELEMLTEVDNDKDFTKDVPESHTGLKEEETVEKNRYDIPLHEMTLSKSPTPYHDPGAPLPIQSSPRSNKSKSIFSPLNFNPIIKSNVDDKYADGGKFFVKKYDDTVSDGGLPDITLRDTFGHDEGDDDDEDDEDYDDYEDYDDDHNNEVDDDDDDSIIDADKGQLSETNNINISDREPSYEASSSLAGKPSENLPDTAEPDTKRLKLTGQSLVDDSSQSANSESNSPTDLGENTIRDKNGVPNCMPFILRSIPMYTIPDNIFKDNPVIQIDQVDTIVDQLLNQIIWNDSYSFEDIPNPTFKDFNENENIERSIAQIFPEIHRTTLFEYSGMGNILNEFTKDNEDNNNNNNNNNDNNNNDIMNIEVESPLSAFQTSNLSPNPNSVMVAAKNPAFTTAAPEVNLSNKPSSSLPDKEESNYIFPLKSPKMRVKRFSQELSIASSALYLWNLMSFRPLNKPKDFKVLLISSSELVEKSTYFLNSFIEIYDYKFQLGKIEKLIVDESFKGLNDGLLMYQNVNDLEKVLLDLARLLVTKSTDENEELLLLFPDPEHSFASTLSKVQLFEQFKNIVRSSNDDKLTKKKISLKMIPGSFISNNGVFSTTSINTLGRLSLNVYNSIGDVNSTYTELYSNLPDSIDFKLTTQSISKDLLSQDSYIHLSYDRSIDKEWLIAAWTDDHSSFRKTKAWYCANNKANVSHIRSIEEVMNEIWDITLKFSSKLKGKKHLILTRLNGMIPDDELLHLKRLSSKTRDLTLIVVSASQHSKLLLEVDDVGFPMSKLFNQQSENENLMNGMMSKDSAPTVGSSSGLTPSMFTPQPINSPDLFTMSKNTNVSYDSPSNEMKNLFDEQNTVVDIGDTVYGVMIDSSETLMNAPSRFSVKTGYLIKPVKNSHNLIRAFEINLLSCPSNLQNDELMKTLLTQFRNLSTISELFCVVDPKDALLPWHIEAVKKVSHCLVHVRVSTTT